MMTLDTRGPSAAAMPSANRMAGNDISASISRMIAPSSLRNCAAITPMMALHSPEITQTAIPTNSDTRAPYNTRVKTSRPNISVPKKNCDDGGRKRRRTRIAEGSTGEISGASTAASVNSRITEKPIMKERWRSRRRSVPWPRGAAITEAVASDPSPTSVMTHPRIRQGVENIDGQVDHHKGEAEDQHGALHQRIIARHDRLHHHAADPRQREYLLDDDGAADRGTQQNAGGGDDQDQRVAQRMLADRPPLAEPLGACGADVILAEHVEHRRARHARQKADLEQRQD